MRKSILTIVLATVYLSIFASPDIKEINYVVTDNGISYFTKIRKGMNDRLIAKNSEGEKTVFGMENVKSYRNNGKEFHRRYLIIPGTQSVQRVFMQRIYSISGFSLYKLDKGNAVIAELSDYYVYKGDMLIYQLNEENYKEVISSFFPKVNMLIWN